MHRYHENDILFLLIDLVKRNELFITKFLSDDRQTPALYSTRLRNKLLAQVSDLQYFKKGKQRFMAFNSDITELLYNDIRKNADLEIKVL